MIQVQCDCGATLNVKDEYASKKGKCPKCGQVIAIPQTEPIEIPLAADADNEMPFAAPQSTSAPPTSDPLYGSSPHLFTPAQVAIQVPTPPAPFPPIAPAFPLQPEYSALQQTPTDINPFQAPQAPLSPTLASSPMIQGQNFQIIGNDIVGSSPIFLPAKCVFCGGDVMQKSYSKRTIYYTPSWVYLGFFIGGLIPLVILVLILRKACIINFGLCEQHRTKRRNRILTFSLLSIASFVGMIVAFVSSGASRSTQDMFLITGLVMLFAFIGFLITLAVVAQLLTAKSHSNGIFTIKGFKPGFLNLFRQ
jgi:hypothetical protein